MVNFLILVANCPFAILGQIVRFYYLGAKLSGCQMILPPKDGNGKESLLRMMTEGKALRWWQYNADNDYD